MRPIVTNRVAWSVDLSVGLSVDVSIDTVVCLPFGIYIRVGPRNHVLDGVQIAPCEGAFFREKTFPGMPDHTGVGCVKMTEPIEMPFGLWSRVGLRNHALVWVQIAPCQGAIFRGNDMPMHAGRHSAVNCAKMVEPIDMPFWLWMGEPRKHVHTGSTWRIPMNHEPCVCCGDAAFCQITLTTC